MARTPPAVPFDCRAIALSMLRDMWPRMPAARLEAALDKWMRIWPDASPLELSRLAPAEWGR